MTAAAFFFFYFMAYTEFHSVLDQHAFFALYYTYRRLGIPWDFSMLSRLREHDVGRR